MADELTPLGRLIRDVQAANRWSYADISNNAAAAGRRLSKSRVESLRNAALPSISVKAIDALAAGLKVSPDQVAEAAMATMGFGVGVDRVDASQAIAADPALSDPMRRVLIAALDAARGETSTPSRRRAGRSNRLQRSAADDPSTTT